MPINHYALTQILQAHVDSSGMVDYLQLSAGRKALEEYLEVLSDYPPNESNWPDQDQVAYWINVYNAFTLKLILDHYPIASIKDIGSAIQIPLVNTPWDIEFIRIGDQYLSLNDVEHRVLRKKWNEPRIHFAINCASISCPRLRNEAYTGNNLEMQLIDQALAFFNDSSKNVLSEERVELSKLLKWYSGDFEKKGSKIDFINRYSNIKIKKGAEIGFLDYNWKLNEKIR